MRVGADLKDQLSSTLTLDATINPDFGQVEVDPAVVNLSAFETFYAEKRPFFVEGSGLFGFGGFKCFNCSNVLVDVALLLPAHRAGAAGRRHPRRRGVRAVPGEQHHPGRGEGHRPHPRRAAGGAAGRRHRARSGRWCRTPEGGRFTEEVEPATNYFVGRVRRNYRGGNLTVGAIATSVTRRFDSDALERAPPRARGGGGGGLGGVVEEPHLPPDGQLRRLQRGGRLRWPSCRLQRSSARYFQRPDRESGGNGVFSDRLRPLAPRRCAGYGGYLRLAKDAGDVALGGAR